MPQLREAVIRLKYPAGALLGAYRQLREFDEYTIRRSKLGQNEGLQGDSGFHQFE